MLVLTVSIHYKLKLSIQRFLGLLGLLPVTSSLYTCLTSLSPSMPSSFSFHALFFFQATSITASCFNLCLTSSFLTLSSLVTPSALLKYLISVACSLLICHFCIVQVTHPYNSVGTTIALNTRSFAPLLSSLLSRTSVLIAPITFDAAPILFSISSSHDPSSLNSAPRYISLSSLLQKGSKMQCTNYCAISLLSIPGNLRNQ